MRVHPYQDNLQQSLVADQIEDLVVSGVTHFSYQMDKNVLKLFPKPTEEEITVQLHQGLRSSETLPWRRIRPGSYAAAGKAAGEAGEERQYPLNSAELILLLAQSTSGQLM